MHEMVYGESIMVIKVIVTSLLTIVNFSHSFVFYAVCDISLK